MAISKWMSWEGGIDLTAVTDSRLNMPNVIVHVARMVHTPVGSAPSGMVLYQPDPGANPLVMGFISEDPAVGEYFGPNIFAGTPFENAPVLTAKIEINSATAGIVSARVTIGQVLIETELRMLGALELVNRAAAAMPPFSQQVLEATAAAATLKINGKAVNIIVPPIGISGGPAAVWSPIGFYAR